MDDTNARGRAREERMLVRGSKRGEETGVKGEEGLRNIVRRMQLAYSGECRATCTGRRWKRLGRGGGAMVSGL